MSDNPNIILTAAELAAMQAEAEAEVNARIGDEPTVDALKKRGLIQTDLTRDVLNFIGNASRIITLLVAEVSQSVGALVIAVAFAVLEYQRVMHGSVALGQSDESAQMIALAVVLANFIVPIYVLRTERGAAQKTIVRRTLKSRWQAFTDWITGDATTESVGWSYNPVLKSAKTIITITTLFLACYDLIGPALDVVLSGEYVRDGQQLYLPIIIVELLMGVGLSFAGVLFLQAASHEIGVRLLTERPASDTAILNAERAKHSAAAAVIRAEVRARHEAAKAQKLADRAAAKAAPANPTLGTDYSPSPAPSTNGKHSYQPAVLSES
ncbi:MAG: hypothetical protein MUF38_01550 [Anaerolineae bacterium]|jgi:hypothetical protein|nr:hypothetical protein [Anaerolineae bacterium]